MPLKVWQAFNGLLCYIPEDRTLCNYCCENLKSYIIKLFTYLSHLMNFINIGNNNITLQLTHESWCITRSEQKAKGCNLTPYLLPRHSDMSYKYQMSLHALYHITMKQRDWKVEHRLNDFRLILTRNWVVSTLGQGLHWA